MIFSVCSSTLKSLSSSTRYSFGAVAPKVKTVIETKNNPQKQKELRGQQQLQTYMSEYSKDFYYIHNKQRKPFALYNLFAHLPSSVTNVFANLVQDPKVTIASDQLYLPKISENSIPVYQSLGEFPNTLRVVNRMAMSLPFIALICAVQPYLAMGTIALHYFIYFKSSFGKATDRFVVKMELLPETQEIVYQKISRTGCINTSRVSVNDIEAVNPEQDLTKYKRDIVFEKSMNSVLNIDMIFRVKSTGEILMFDREGVWHEEGLNHELMP